MGSADIRVESTDDLAAVRALGVACGLDDSERADEVIVKSWGAYDGDRLVGAIALERLQELDTINWMAVDEDYRRLGIAARLYAALEAEARRRGLPRLSVTARNPAFFEAQGFHPVDDATVVETLLGDCPRCEQYGHGCEPRALTKPIDQAGPDEGP